MDCATFFETAAAVLGDEATDPTHSTPGRQCVFEFFHPRVVEAFGTDGLATRFNRSGVVWAPPGARLGVQLRVPEAYGEATSAALADAPMAFEQTDHRGVAAGEGETVTVLHYTGRADGLQPTAVESTLSAVAAALSV